MRCCGSAASHFDLSAHGDKQSDCGGERARAEQQGQRLGQKGSRAWRLTLNIVRGSSLFI